LDLSAISAEMAGKGAGDPGDIFNENQENPPQKELTMAE
jgi:hypothetical protein